MFNLALHPASSLEKKIQDMESKVFAIDLHWAVHSQGAIKVAELCKRHHPSSHVVVGGFTATWFDREILENYPCVDIIVLGEGEEPMLGITKGLLSDEKSFTEVDGVSFRRGRSIKRNPISAPINSLDELDFVNISLMEDWRKYTKVGPPGYLKELPSSFWLPIARGCTNDCVFCGGGRSSYQLFSKREKCIFRSPGRVADDVRILYDLGILTIRFTHDPEIGGRKYSLDVLSEIRKTGADVSIYWESFALPSRSVLEELSKVAFSSRIAVSPESPSDQVRMKSGRNFTNRELLRTIDTCEELGIALDVYFNSGLPGETREFSVLFKKMADRIAGKLWTRIEPPIPFTLDPNCLMAVSPQQYGVKLHFRKFEDYRRMCSSPYPLDWIGYETAFLSREEIVALSQEAVRYVSTLPKPLMR